MLVFSFSDPVGKSRSPWGGYDPVSGTYPVITTHAQVPPYTQTQIMTVAGT